MAKWLPDIELDAAAITRVIDEQFPELDASARGVTRIGAGWDNAVWRIGEADEADPVAFRFTQRHIGTELAVREMAVMPAIAPLLPAPVTAPTYIGTTTEDVPLPWFGYPLLPGDEAIVHEHDVPAQRRLATQLGTFLAALHGDAVQSAVDELGVPMPTDGNRRSDVAKIRTLTSESMAASVTAGYDVSPNLRRRSANILATADRAAYPRRPLFVHGDLHVRHVLADTRGDVTGVIDWGTCR